MIKDKSDISEKHTSQLQVNNGNLSYEKIEEAEHNNLIVDIEGFSGPLDLLLTLARKQKVDLVKISILDLVEQYSSFINKAKELNLDLAADYLVMATWLAYLKSKLLLPTSDDDDDLSGEEMAARLALKLKYLDDIRNASVQLTERPILGRDFLLRGNPEGITKIYNRQYNNTLYDLLKAYANCRVRQESEKNFYIAKLPVWSIEDARKYWTKKINKMREWQPLFSHIKKVPKSTFDNRRSIIASSVSASLELVREGKMEMQQNSEFSHIYVRAKN